MPLPDPSEKSVAKIRNMVEKFTEKSGTFTHPIEEIAEDVILGLALHSDELGKRGLTQPEPRPNDSDFFASHDARQASPHPGGQGGGATP